MLRQTWYTQYRLVFPCLDLTRDLALACWRHPLNPQGEVALRTAGNETLRICRPGAQQEMLTACFSSSSFSSLLRWTDKIHPKGSLLSGSHLSGLRPRPAGQVGRTQVIKGNVPLGLLHIVPALIDALPWASLAKIVAVIQAHRGQVHDKATSIALKDVMLVENGHWLYLNTWKFTHYCQFNSSKVNISYTGKRFNMSLQPLSKAAVGETCLASLSMIDSSVFPLAGLMSIDVSSFAALNREWSHLKQRNLAYNHLDLSAMAELTVVPIRQLLYLNLSGNNMGVRAQDLCKMAKGRWSDLRVLIWSSNAISVSAVVALSKKLSTAKLASKVTVLTVSTIRVNPSLTRLTLIIS